MKTIIWWGPAFLAAVSLGLIFEGLDLRLEGQRRANALLRARLGELNATLRTVTAITTQLEQQQNRVFAGQRTRIGRETVVERLNQFEQGFPSGVQLVSIFSDGATWTLNGHARNQTALDALQKWLQDTPWIVGFVWAEIGEGTASDVAASSHNAAQPQPTAALRFALKIRTTQAIGAATQAHQSNGKGRS